MRPWLLAWVQTQPACTSTIIGARRVDQLNQNFAALELKLDASHPRTPSIAYRQPSLNFPADFLQFAPSFMHAGATVNGEKSQLPPMMPKTERRTVTEAPQAST